MGFQYSIRDAGLLGRFEQEEVGRAFNTLLEMPMAGVYCRALGSR